MSEVAQAKSLRWLANQFPPIPNADNTVDKMNNLIHIYATAGADKIDALGKELEEVRELLKEVNNK